MKKLPVSVVKSKDIYSEKDVINGVMETLELIGGLREIVNPSDTVLLKPNFVTARKTGTGAVTSNYVLKGLVKACKKAGAKKTIIGESSFLGEDTEAAFLENNLYDSFKGERVEFVDFKKDEYISVPIESGRVIHKVKLPRTYLEADVIINVPVLKTHDVLPVSLGLKNMKGVLRDTDKRRFHKLGLEQAIIDLNKVVMPDLVFYDGLIGMEGHGPIYGEPVEMGVMIASRNIMGAELVAANLMGFSREELVYLNYAEKEGLGSLENIEVVGEEIERIKKQFRRSNNVYEKLSEFDIKVYDEQACSKCRATLNSIILNDLPIFDSIRGYTICLGSIPEGIKDNKILLIGSCLRQHANNKEILYVPGCSPTQISIINTIKRRRNLSML